MILRRVIQHVRRQEWTAIVIDLLIVIFGVIIGLQVSNWNEDRLTKVRATLLTERLAADLRADAWWVAWVYRYNDDVMTNAERTLQALTGEIDVPNTVLLVSAFRASQFPRFSKNRATYDELVATGGIGLVSDQDLRMIAIQYYNSLLFDNIQYSGIRAQYRENYRQIMPPPVHRETREKCGDIGSNIVDGDYSSLGKILDYNCVPDLPQTSIDDAVSALRDNAAIVPALRLRIATIETELADLKDDFEDSLWARFAGGWVVE